MNHPALSHEEFSQRWTLSIAKLEQDASAGLKMGGGALRKGAIEAKAIRAAIERQARVVVAHLRLQKLDFSGGNIRRIGNNYVEALRWLESR